MYIFALLGYLDFEVLSCVSVVSVCSCLADFVRFRSFNGLKLLWELSVWGGFLAF